MSRLKSLMSKTRSCNKNSLIILVTILFVGSSLRIIVATRGYNCDVAAFMHWARGIQEVGLRGNIYSDTMYDTYGPIWAYLLYMIDNISAIMGFSLSTAFDMKPIQNVLVQNNYRGFVTEDIIGFRYVLAIFLTLVDIGIFFVLLRKYSMIIGTLFFLNPIAVIITGYHNQFGNLAILIGLFAIIIFGESVDEKLGWRKIAGLVLLGVSITTKHLLFLFPLWLAIKQKGLTQKVVVLTLPLIIFFVSFMPYWEGGSDVIISKTFLMKGWEHSPFWRIFLPQVFSYFIPNRFFMFAGLIIFAFVFRKRNVFDSLLIYTACLILFMTSVGNQRLAVVVPFMSVYFNWFFLIYTVYGAFHLMTDVSALSITGLRDISPHILLDERNFYYLTVILFIGILWIFYKETMITKCTALLIKVKDVIAKEIRFQIKGE